MTNVNYYHWLVLANIKTMDFLNGVVKHGYTSATKVTSVMAVIMFNQ